MQLAIVFLTFLAAAQSNLQECAKFYNPNNYMTHLPSLQLPYWGDIPVPVSSPLLIKPSPVIKTKAISVVTKYVYKNPVCVRYSKGKSACKLEGNIRNKEGFDHLVTKEYFVKDKEVSVNLSRDARADKRSKRDDDEDDSNDIR